jgi:putative polyhydroxyalkanoate system protein
MAKLNFSHQHTQPESVVRDMLNGLVEKLKADYDITSVWHGNRIDFSRSGASGTLTLHPHRIDIEIKLSMFLSMFESKIRDTLTSFCRDNLP